jgi:hypothetical protein
MVRTSFLFERLRFELVPGAGASLFRAQKNGPLARAIFCTGAQKRTREWRRC